MREIYTSPVSHMKLFNYKTLAFLFSSRNNLFSVKLGPFLNFFIPVPCPLACHPRRLLVELMCVWVTEKEN